MTSVGLEERLHPPFLLRAQMYVCKRHHYTIRCCYNSYYYIYLKCSYIQAFFLFVCHLVNRLLCS